MKRILVTILSILYMTAATGATVHVHYCMGKLIKAGFADKEEDECGKCGMKKKTQKKGCCKDEHKTFKSGDHSASNVSPDLSYKALISPVPTVATPFYSDTVPVICCSELPTAHGPPHLLRACPIFIFVCNFRI